MSGQTLSERLDVLTGKLAELSVSVYKAYDELTAAEEAWLPKLDAVAETLREENREVGRAAPAEHVALSAARARYPAEYQRFRRAKRDVARLELISQNRRAELSGLQTERREKGGEGQQPASTRGLPQHAQRKQAA